MVDPFQRRMSVERFRRFYAGRPDEERWELINGVATKLARSTLPHQRIVIFSLVSSKRCANASLC